ncbi:MAG: hypothetical protein KatS3mg105_4857 [Gemmatales bacterium]|nr:MAG: hypothetical protein KatS3mg105_4857 [Gemmatales bacterium]
MFGFNHVLSRRHFMKHMAAGFSALALPSFQFISGLRAAAPELKKKGKSIIILWMSGGPPTIDLWDLKPGAPTNFEDYEPVPTAAEGIKISPFLPKVASQMKELVIIRSLSTNEGSHDRGTQLMHTSRAPNPVVTYPSIGSMATYQMRDYNKDLDLPSFISIGGSRGGAGFLGAFYAPFNLQNPGTPPANIRPPRSLGTGLTEKERIRRRQRLFYAVEDSFASRVAPHAANDEQKMKDLGYATKDHAEIYGKAFNLVASDRGKVFEIGAEDQKYVEEYGNNGFGRGCLMARKLVEAGVTAVEVNLGGWDLHGNTLPTLQNQRLPVLDNGMGTLVKDLKERGLWQDTVLVWMGEFGRTPRINQNAGRDHWPRCWSVVIGGGAIQGGQVYGSTNADGTNVKDDKCSVADVFATLYKGMGIDPATQIRDNLGRPMPITEGKPLKGLV